MRVTRNFSFACFVYLVILAIGTSSVHAALLMHSSRWEMTSNPYPAQGHISPSPAMPETIIISTSASTNECGSILVVSSTGDIILFSCNHYGQRLILPALATIFFHDVNAIQSLENLPVNPNCLKGASFGTTTVINFELQTSPDISCSLDRSGKKLYQDTQAIQVIVSKESRS